MLLVIDIGNTNLTLGIFKEDKLLKKIHISTDLNKTPEEYYVLLKNLFDKDLDKITKSLICSVVSPINKSIEETLNIANIKSIHFLNVNDLEQLFKLEIKNKNEIGIDRLINGLGAYLKFKKDIIAVDLGTATTFDVVTKNAEFLGGIIIPGIYTSLNGLYSKVSKLPRVDIKKPNSIIGKTTSECIQSGIYYGYLYTMKGIIEKISIEQGQKFYIIGTGGLVNLFSNEEIFDYIDDSFTLKSINSINKYLQL